MSGISGIPRLFNIILARLSNWSVQTTTVGMPFFPSSTASWILHDEHDPQSAIAVMTRSESAAKWDSILMLAALEGDSF